MKEEEFYFLSVLPKRTGLNEFYFPMEQEPWPHVSGSWRKISQIVN